MERLKEVIKENQILFEQANNRKDMESYFILGESILKEIEQINLLVGDTKSCIEYAEEMAKGIEPKEEYKMLYAMQNSYYVAIGKVFSFINDYLDTGNKPN